MRPLPSHRRPASGRLARRLVLLFLGAALVPVLISDWLSIGVMTQVAERLDRDTRQQLTQQVGRQVLDRLLAAKAVMTATVHAGSARTVRSSEIFRKTVCPGSVAAAGAADADADADADSVLSLWRRAAPPRVPAVPRDDRSALRVEMRTLAVPGGRSRLLFGASAGSTLVCVAELRPEFVWAPVVNASEDTAWSVNDALGQALTVHRGADVALPEAPHRRFEARLFLAGEFASDSWQFEQQAPAPALHWHGVPLAGWLGGVALATLLVVGLYGGRKIHRALAPLEALTQGTLQLAAGITTVRMVIEVDDEIGALGDAFNQMAGRLQTQFSTLRNLSEIDTGILSGAPLAELARHVADQLMRLYPQALPTVYWREGPFKLRSVTGQADAGADADTDADADPTAHPNATTVSDVELTRSQVDRFERLLDGDSLDLALGKAPAPPAHGAAPRHAAMTIRQAGRTSAVIVLHSAHGSPTAELAPARDLTDRLAVAFVARTREQELVHRAVHDQLTGLANGYGLQTHLEHLLAQAGGARTAVLFIDLDHFKEVNDNHGHGVGDELLRLVGARIGACLPEPALLARKGGDEFVVVLPGAAAETACACAARIVAALRQPAVVRGLSHGCGASIGIALGPEHGRTQEELLRCADVALYVAKNAGRSQYAVFSASFDHAARQRVALLAALRLAVTRDELVLHYQPRLRASDGVIVSAEALVRWQHPERGLLMPDSFIELAESSDLIGPIGDWVLERACAQIARWQDQGLALERVSVNVSAHQLAPGDLPAKVGAALDRYRVAPHRLELEITESLLAGDVRAAHAQLARIRELGVTIAMDDFGTGQSSMALLRKLPIDVLKIDRAFVTDMVDDPSALAITRAIVTLAKSLSLRLVAEGIETEAQADLLRSMGCDEFQGFLYGKPVAAPEFARLPRTSLYVPASTPASTAAAPAPMQATDALA